MLIMHISLDFNCKIATGWDNSAALHTGSEIQNRQKLTTYIFSSWYVRMRRLLQFIRERTVIGLMSKRPTKITTRISSSSSSSSSFMKKISVRLRTFRTVFIVLFYMHGISL